jgi:NDP-sugar pyrophosphorylase family protein
MKLCVLAGGFGTRLQSAVSDVPKALAPICGVPFLRLQIEQWIAQGIQSFIFLLHYKASLIIDFLKKEKTSLLAGYEVTWLIEPTPLGTGGAIAYAVRELRITGNIFVTNADTWLEVGVVKSLNAKSPALAVVYVRDCGRYGRVIFNDKKTILSFEEKARRSDCGWINAGLSVLDASLFFDWDGKYLSLESKCYPLWISQGLMTVIEINGNFIDIGIPDDYFRFCSWIRSGKVNLL